VAWAERYQETRRGPARSEPWSRTFKVGPEGSLVLNNLSGNVIVNGGAGDEIRIEAVKRVNRRDTDEAKQQLSAVTIEATENAGRVVVETVFPRGRHDLHVSVDFTVVVPWTAAVAVRTVAGDIQVSKVKGEVQVESVSGDLLAIGIPKLARAKSVSGDVEINDAAGADVLAIGTVSGDLSARKVKARSIELQTVSGDLALIDSACEQAQVRSVSGNVEFGGTLAKGGRYDFTSHSGDVLVSLAGTTGFQLTANTFSGSVRSEVPLQGTQGTDVTPVGSGHPGQLPGRRELKGTFGDGSAYLVIKSFSGSVTVTSKDGGPKAGDNQARKPQQ
jgi:DUF4097 and DUF4098 domain-containing protein YvlB